MCRTHRFNTKPELRGLLPEFLGIDRCEAAKQGNDKEETSTISKFPALPQAG